MLRQYLPWIVVSLSCTAASVNGQSRDPGYNGSPNPQAFLYPAPGYMYGHHSSTYAEGVQHGFADVLRADGEREFNMSRAAGNYEDARHKSLKNHKHEVAQYFELRLMNKAYRQALKGTPRSQAKTSEQVARAAEYMAPAPVREDGTICWPAALEREITRDARQLLEEVFARRATGHDTRLGTEEHRAGSQALAMIAADLKSLIHFVPPGEYLAAKKVLKSLQHEMEQPLQQSMLSQN